MVLETGDDAPRIRPNELDQTAVIARSAGETLLDLVQRAIHRIAMMDRSNIALLRVTVFLAPDCDPQAMAARRLLGSAVLAHATATARPCELVFAGSPQHRKLLVHLWQLVEVLVTEPGSSKVPIRLQFGDERPLKAS